MCQSITLFFGVLVGPFSSPCPFCQFPISPGIFLVKSGEVSKFCWFSQELLLRNLVMRSTMFYGFRVRMWVPLRPPSRSTNAFYLELLGPNFAGNHHPLWFWKWISHFQIRCSIFWVGGVKFRGLRKVLNGS